MELRVRPIFIAFILAAVLLVSLGWLLALSADPLAVTAAPSALRFVDADNVPLANTPVRLLCYPTPSATVATADLMVTTDGGGFVPVGLPPGCDHLAALHQIYTQASGKPGHGPAYWVYATSWRLGSDTLVPATGTVMLDDTSPFVLFNVVASLDWQPVAGDPYLSQLRQGLRAASDYLYDLTEGQMAFGPVTLHSDGRNWNGADFRFSAANDKRPSAFVGGIVTNPISYTDTLTPTVYAPGAVYLGRYWDGNNAFDATTGRWSNQDAARTLIHEWAHYALFLYDEYQDTSGEKTYCTGPNNRSELSDASAMDYHYTTSEFWHPQVHDGLISPPNCTNTRQWQVHGHSDWETLVNWTNIQQLPDGVPSLSFPGVLESNSGLRITGALFGRWPGHRLYLPTVTVADGPPPAPVSQPAVHLHVEDSLVPTDTLPTQIYLLKGTADGELGRILHQGTVTGTPGGDLLGSTTLLGVEPDDRARVVVERYATDLAPTGGRFVFPGSAAADAPLTDGMHFTATFDAWRPSLDAYYGLAGNRLTTMTVNLVSYETPEASPMVQLCLPDAAIGCPDQWQKTMTLAPGSTVTWTTSFTPLLGHDELPLYSVLHVTAPGLGEMVRWVQVTGGVGPAHDDGIAPLRDGPVMVDTNDSLVGPGSCNRVIVMPAAEGDALKSPLDRASGDEAYGGIVGLPLDIDILLPYDLCPQHGPGDHTLPPMPVLLTMFYDQATIDRLGISESALRIIHYDRGTGVWSEVSNAAPGLHEELNWLSIGPIIEDGIYAVVWVAP